jgi:hypothetical protein
MREDLEEMRRDGLSAQVRERFSRSQQAVRRWEREHPTTIDSILDWIDQLRAVFGEPPVNLEPWRGDDFRL